MSLYIQGMSSCLVQEICNISLFKSPEEILIAFCKQTIGSNKDCGPSGGYRIQRSDMAETNNVGTYVNGLGENYVFSGVEKGGMSMVSPFRQADGYCSRFAAFIIENNLGEVTAGKLRNNHRFHKDHFGQVFIWNPDREAVFKWWEKTRRNLVVKPPVIDLPESHPF